MKITKTLTAIAAAMLCLAVTGCKKTGTENGSDNTIHVESVTIYEVGTEFTLTAGSTRQLYISVLPENATDRSVSWSSSSAAATVEGGLVTAVNKGIAIITATSTDGGKTAMVTVNVAEAVGNVLEKITDPVFLAYCEAHMEEFDENGNGQIDPSESGWDSDENGELSMAEAAEVKTIDVNGNFNKSWWPEGGAKVRSMEGLEYFTGLTRLECWKNEITELDLSANAALTYLRCDQNKLTSLDVASNTALASLLCYMNPLTGLDVSKNTALTALYIFDTPTITSIDVSKNPELQQLEIDGTGIRSFDVSGNTKLTQLKCAGLQLTELDVTHNPMLWQLYCNNNNLTELDVTNNPLLADLYCSQNQLTELDVTNNPAMKNLYCEQNQLSALDLTKCPALDMFSCSKNKIAALDVSKNTAMRRLWFADNLFTTIDISKNTLLEQFDPSFNPGNGIPVEGVAKFVVKTWFNKTKIPATFPKENEEGNWIYNGMPVAIDYQIVQ
jgi:hypothetical protein